MTRVFESAVLDVPIDAVWRVLRDFNAHRLWHPAITESRIEGDVPADSPGAVRAFRLTDGGFLREQLLTLDDARRELSYCLLEAPLPLHGYVATIRLRPVSATGQTFWTWESRFTPPASRAEELAGLVSRDIYRAGFRALEAHLQSLVLPEVSGPRATAAPVPPSLDVPARPGPAAAGLARGSRRARTIVQTGFGGPEVLVGHEVAVAEPGPGEVLVAQSHVGVNFIDVYCRTGYFRLVDPPGIPGMEAAGTVAALGPGVTDLSLGTPVAYACAPTGAYTTLRVMPAGMLARLPPWLPGELAAAVMLKGMTAGFLLRDVARIVPGDWVVVHAAAGGVGALLLQWARALGARVIATVSTPDKVDLPRRLGADRVAIGRGEAFLAAVGEATAGQGVATVFDAVGATSFDASLEALAIRGHLVSFGQASGPIGPRDVGAMAAKSITLSRPNYGHFVGTPSQVATQCARLFAALDAGHLLIPTPTVLPLDQAAEAHRLLEAGRSVGPIVLATGAG